MVRIKTLDGHRRRSTQELLQTIEAAVLRGDTEFDIEASGQHDIGGPLWNREGKELLFRVRNPGQRVGAMCLPGTTVLVDGPAPADAGWLNSGGRIVIRGDAGDTAGHCAAAGVIQIGGRAGARAGSLMKHDPQYEEPSLWVLRTVGDFSFEFMGGGRAVVCGLGCAPAVSPLGARPCVGMVGGAVYFRGEADDLPEDVLLSAPDDNDMSWLKAGLANFLASVGHPDLLPELSDRRQWNKITPVPFEQRKRAPVMDMGTFRRNAWVPGGIFGDVLEDDGRVTELAAPGDERLRVPVWNGESCRDCRLCLKSCPRKAIVRTDGEKGVYSAACARCVGCGLCAGLCPCGAWRMTEIASV
ncbi:MAG: glutamate synthase [Desulfovibrio sp.]|nr:glutamate synthase [Desulfovibrio sp.]